MGSKYKPEVNSNPGPGQYDGGAKEKVKGSRIGSAVRPGLWEKETKDDKPGPGNYADETNTFGKAVKGGANMGSKFKPEKNENPGPGQYSVSDSQTKKAGANQRISKAKRGEIWEKQTKNDVPGPGNYMENTSSFANAKGGATMGGRYREESNLNPGPGQYDLALFDMSNQQSHNVKIGTQKVRADLFGTDAAAN